MVESKPLDLKSAGQYISLSYWTIREMVLKAKASLIRSQLHANRLVAKIPRYRRWRVADRGKQLMAVSKALRHIAFPELFRKNAA